MQVVGMAKHGRKGRCSMEKSTNPIFLSSNWYVAHCAPFKEVAVAAALQDQLGLETYLPMIERPYRGQVQPTPFFPRYVFVRTELHSRTIYDIHAIAGVLRLLAFDGLPQAVPTAVVNGIREHVDRINAQGGLSESQFCPGESVCITAGPLEGLEAVFLKPMQQSERVKVMIEFLGHLREAEVPVSTLEKARHQSITKRPRRTRGRGRPIKALLA